MKPQKLLLFTLLLFAIFAGQAQTVYVTTLADKRGATGTEAMNMFKVNLPALVLKNISVQYERVLSQKTAVALNLRIMPPSTIPFKNLILKSVGDDEPDTKETIEKLRLSNFAITPEFRWYVGKTGYGEGFYIAPFYRFASYKSNDLIFFYDDDLSNQQSITMTGKLTSHTGGLLIGAQWLFGTHVVLDWWILGLNYGAGTGNFSGITSQSLSASEQDNLRQELEDLEIPFTNKTVTVTSNGANLKLDGPWGGLRAGICLGIRF